MLPILTLNNMLDYNSSLFDSVAIPADASKQTLLDTIVRNYGEMQVTIPDWSLLRYYTESWFSANRLRFARLWDVYKVEYNPIWNKDGVVEEVRTPDLLRTRKDTRTPDLENKTTYDSKVKTTDTGNITQQTMGFNSSAFADLNKEVPDTTNTATRSGNDTVAFSGTETTDSTEMEKGKEKTTRTERGNIGLTTTQHLVQEEVDLWTNFGFYDTIAKMYATEFLVMIY